MSWYAVGLNDMQLLWFHPMHTIELTNHCAIVCHNNKKKCWNYVSNCATAYLTVQLLTPTSIQEKVIKNDMVNTYHDVVTTYFMSMSMVIVDSDMAVQQVSLG